MKRRHHWTKLLLTLLPFALPAQAETFEEDWNQVDWADLMVEVPAAEAELNITEVTLSRADWLAEANKQADAALAAGDWARAEYRLAQALAEYPDAHDTRLRLAAMLFGRGDPDQARVRLQQGLELVPDHADMRLALARLLAAQERFPAALRVLDDVSPLLHRHLDYYSLKAEMARRSGRCDLAIGLYQRLLDSSRVGAWWLGLGLCQRELGQNFTLAFEQARASADLGNASLRFVEQQLEQYGTAQTH
ncbi:tetratricopeptide repeat protein [Zobellella iuensis]|uniref:Tetratricopeptide repeat protein n=1 Tax=Zobellella iuensis TaxID=2803811 RepID=A0ABS1QQQ4_9GAMM|nr:tetratricopeptide repeat protein [Zobellella iuensis]MBL1377202.1 tetratricopeptide repeat protein [Zobellella iuensis]